MTNSVGDPSETKRLLYKIFLNSFYHSAGQMFNSSNVQRYLQCDTNDVILFGDTDVYIFFKSYIVIILCFYYLLYSVDGMSKPISGASICN
jgi:hypothetical protein